MKLSEQPELRFLFRFRDLIANTLAEHERIIKDHGSCWWGWWKRPNEEPHQRVWDELKREASTASPVDIGLFHSGSGKVYLAKVSGVIPPTDSGEQVSVPETDTHLVPEYYRKSPFSRAWLRLAHVGLEPIAFFNNYSYEAIPQIPNYASPVNLSKRRAM